jgi:hypothetical protein
VEGRNVADWGYEVIPQRAANAPTRPGQDNRESRFVGGGISEGEATTPLWLNFLECCRTRNRETMSTPELGAAAFTTVNMGVLSYRQGQALFWDKERRRPVPADASWAERWERRSHERGRPNQINGWQGGTRGSTLSPPEYMRLAGPWNNGQDPATRGSEE